MPIYEYECLKCGNRFEYLVLRTSPAAECPACQATDLNQLISLCGVSSESTRHANLTAEHAKAAGIRKEKAHAEHKEHHDHFGS